MSRGIIIAKQGPEFGRLPIGVGQGNKTNPGAALMSSLMIETRQTIGTRGPEAPSPAPRDEQRWWDAVRAATGPSTASCSSPSAPPESIAGRAAPRARPGARTSRSSQLRTRRRRPATAPASAAGPTGSARPIRGSSWSGLPAPRSSPPRRPRSSPIWPQARASAPTTSTASSRRSPGSRQKPTRLRRGPAARRIRCARPRRSPRRSTTRGSTLRVASTRARRPGSA